MGAGVGNTLHAFPGHISRELEQNQSGWDSNPHATLRHRQELPCLAATPSDGTSVWDSAPQAGGPPAPLRPGTAASPSLRLVDWGGSWKPQLKPSLSQG